MAGPLALVGSGEYTPAMLPVERELIDGRTWMVLTDSG